MSDLNDDQMKAPTKVFMDAQGRMVDEKGNVINMKQQKEFKVNQNTQKETQNKNLEKIIRQTKHVVQSKQDNKRKFFDQALEQSAQAVTKREKRRSGGFNFVQQGTYIKKGEVMRKKQVNEQLVDFDIGGSLLGTGSDTVTLPDVPPINIYGEERMRVHTTLARPAEAPQLDWWDSFLLPEGQEQFKGGKVEESDIYLDRITHFIQHPVPLQNELVKADERMTIPFMLTEKEKKKLRRKKRLQKEKDKQEKVQLGLMPAPEARVTMSNFMKVMAKEAIQNPTACERKVQQIVTKRVNEHVARNEAGKLNKDQKEAKMKRKHDRDTANECKMCVFRVQNVQLQAQLRFKVDMNAQQLHLGGVCLIADKESDLPNIIVVEGGPTAIKKYKKLLLKRIDWKQYAGQQLMAQAQMNEASATTAQNKKPECLLVWEGVVHNKKIFEKWRLIDVKTNYEAKRVFTEKNQEHLFSMAMSLQTHRVQEDDEAELMKIVDSD